MLGKEGKREMSRAREGKNGRETRRLRAPHRARQRVGEIGIRGHQPHAYVRGRKTKKETKKLQNDVPLGRFRA